MANGQPSEGPRISQFAYGWIAGGVIVMLYLIGSGVLMQLSSSGNVQDWPEGLSQLQFFLWASTSQILFFLVPTLIAVRWSPAGPVSTLRLKKPHALDITLASLGMICCSVLAGFYVAVQELYLVPDSLREFYSDQQQRAGQIDEILFIDGNIGLLMAALFSISMLPAVAEEFFFRGTLQRSFESELRPLAAILLTATLFAGIHFQPTHIVPLIGVGMFLGYAAWRTQSIWTAVAGHFFFNAVQIVGLNIAPGSVLAEQNNVTSSDVIDALPAAIAAALVLVIAIRTLRKRHHHSISSSSA